MGASQSLSVSSATTDQLAKVGVFDLRSSQRVGIQQLYEKVLKRLLNESNLYDFALISDKNKCTNLVMFVASTLEKEFTATRFPDPDNPSEIRSVLFAPKKQYETLTSRDSALSRKRRAICEDIAFFMIRFITYIASLSASMYYTPTALNDLIRTDIEQRTLDVKEKIFIPSLDAPPRPLSESIIDFFRKYTDASGRPRFRDFAALNAALLPGEKNEMDIASELTKIRESSGNANAKAVNQKTIEAKYWGQDYFKNAAYYYFDFGSSADRDIVIDVKRSIVFWQRADLKQVPVFNLTVGITDRPGSAASYRSSLQYSAMPPPSGPYSMAAGPAMSVGPGSAAPFAPGAGSNARSLIGSNAFRQAGAFAAVGGKRRNTRRAHRSAHTTTRRRIRAQRGGDSDLGNYYIFELRLVGKEEVVHKMYVRRDGMVQDERTGEMRQFDQKMVEIFSEAMRTNEKEQYTLVNPLARPLSSLYGPIYDNFEAFAKTLSSVPERMKEEVGGSAPAFYRAFLLATRSEEAIDSAGKRSERVYTLLCENKWNSSRVFTDTAPYALLQALYTNAKDKDAEAKAQLQAKIKQFVAEGVTSRERTAPTGNGEGFDKLRFADIKDVELCKATSITADRAVNAVIPIRILKEGHRRIRDAFDRHVEAAMKQLRKAIRLEDTGVVNSSGFKDYNIHLENVFFKESAGSQRAIEDLIAEAREMIANHYLEVEKIFVSTAEAFKHESHKLAVIPVASAEAKPTANTSA